MDIDKIIASSDYQDASGKVNCGHDFWDKQTEFGDVVLCTRCNNFFTKVKKLPYFVRKRNSFLPAKIGFNNVAIYVRVPLQERS